MIYLNYIQIIPTLFPDNTSQVWKLPENLLKSDIFEIHWEFSHEGEFLQLAQLKHLLDIYRKTTNLTLKYLPYGRQDKEITNSTTFALTTFAHLLNHLQFNNIYILDPHSEVALKLIYNSEAEYPIDQIHDAGFQVNANLVVYPDKGALDKYSKIYPFAYIYGEKVRDQLTGYITSYKLIGNPAGKNVLIVDDICDGGATFKILAKDLYNAGAKQVFLFVTHGIFSQGIRTLKEAGIQRVFTIDGEINETQNGFTYRRI